MSTFKEVCFLCEKIEGCECSAPLSPLFRDEMTFMFQEEEEDKVEDNEEDRVGPDGMTLKELMSV